MGMTKHQWQKKLYESGTEQISEIVHEDIFIQLCHGNGYLHWDDNYYCIIEQIEGEKRCQK